LAEFLRFVADDPLFALWWLVALRGLRRGEVAGLRWQDIDLDRRQLTIVRKRTTVGYQVVEGPPKSAASRRTVALDRRTVTVLRAHLRHRREWYAATGRRWRADGYVFTRPDGRAYHPNYLTHRLRFLINAAGLPPVLLHYLRHGAASLAHTAGADIKTSRTSSGAPEDRAHPDTYTTVLPAAQHKAAEATARLVRAAARDARAKITGRRRPAPSTRSPQKSATAPPASTPQQDKPAGQGSRKANRRLRRVKATGRHPQPATVHDGRSDVMKPQVAGWAAGDSNPEPMD
jgi:integrase